MARFNLKRQADVAAVEHPYRREIGQETSKKTAFEFSFGPENRFYSH